MNFVSVTFVGVKNKEEFAGIEYSTTGRTLHQLFLLKNDDENTLKIPLKIIYFVSKCNVCLSASLCIYLTCFLLLYFVKTLLSTGLI